MSQVVVNATNMFVVPLVTIQCVDWENKKLRLNEISKSLPHLPKVGMSTDFMEILKQRKSINNENIQNIFYDEILAFKNNFKLSKVNVIATWFEETHQGSFHSYHSHGALGYSAVCYINFDESVHESTMFNAPFFNFVTGEDLVYTIPNPKEGMIIFFPSCIYHSTVPNLSTIPRKIVSFNMTVAN